MSSRDLIEQRLHALLPISSIRGAHRLNSAIHYAIFPGGRRMRPMLTLLGAKAAGARLETDLETAIEVACAVEFLHASSLILDDLPAMDNARERRGRPALHLVFGEDVGMLAALALLNQAYGIFGRSPRLIAEAVSCIGVNGTIGGQAVDLAHRGANNSGQGIEKTTALLRFALTAGAIAYGAGSADVRALARCGECLGEAYQIYDDLLDGDLPEHASEAHLLRAGELITRSKESVGIRGTELAAAIDRIFEEFSHPLLTAQ
ncbi:MAG: polyprenyl synthetase family protein [Acidobacteriota bacterium]|nr:polyprenyl synthetase family protein [Acidobacteriota bacterium]